MMNGRIIPIIGKPWKETFQGLESFCSHASNTWKSATQQSNPKSGSALIMVLAVVVMIAVLIAGFGADMKGELRGASSFYEETINYQLARSALALARVEIQRQNARLYADDYGNAYFIRSTEDYEEMIEELSIYRDGFETGRGMLSYKIIYKPHALDVNALTPEAWHRLLEIACEMEEGEERSELVDCAIDWIDTDTLQRASGAEEEFYQELDPPRHCKNNRLDQIEELLLVNGFTSEMLFGYDNPARLEDGMVVGGGLYRFFLGDNSPEAQASIQFIKEGIPPTEGQFEEVDEDDVEFREVEDLPSVLYLIAQGFVPEDTGLAEEDELVSTIYEDEEELEPAMASRHIMLLRLILPKGRGSYQIEDMMENIGSEMLERVLVYGVPGEEYAYGF